MKRYIALIFILFGFIFTLTQIIYADDFSYSENNTLYNVYFSKKEDQYYASDSILIPYVDINLVYSDNSSLANECAYDFYSSKYNYTNEYQGIEHPYDFNWFINYINEDYQQFLIDKQNYTGDGDFINPYMINNSLDCDKSSVLYIFQLSFDDEYSSALTQEYLFPRIAFWYGDEYNPYQCSILMDPEHQANSFKESNSWLSNSNLLFVQCKSDDEILHVSATENGNPVGSVLNFSSPLTSYDYQNQSVPHILTNYCEEDIQNCIFINDYVDYGTFDLNNEYKIYPTYCIGDDVDGVQLIQYNYISNVLFGSIYDAMLSDFSNPLVGDGLSFNGPLNYIKIYSKEADLFDNIGSLSDFSKQVIINSSSIDYSILDLSYFKSATNPNVFINNRVYIDYFSAKSTNLPIYILAQSQNGYKFIIDLSCDHRGE